MIHLVLPRDLSVYLVAPAWLWVSWRLGIGFWIGPGLRIQPGGPWRLFGWFTMLAVGLIVLIYQDPYIWVLS